MENQHLLNNRLPYGNAKMVLGILAIITSPILVGFVLGFVSIYLVDKDTKMLKLLPGNYNNTAIRQHKQGIIIAWIGFIISVTVTIIIIYMYSKYGTLNMEMYDAMKKTSGGR